MARNQNTIAASATLTGAGLHTNEQVLVTLSPAEPGTGVVFVRTDLPGHPRIPIDLARVDNRGRRTAIRGSGGRDGGVEVHTVEHLLACLLALSIDNLEAHVSGGELPGMDGSALPYLEALQAVGLREQDEEAEEFDLAAQVAFDNPEDDVSIVALPSERGLFVNYTLDYGTPEIPLQRIALPITPETFRKEIAPARTFCLESEAKALRESGLGQGANTRNTLVVGSDGKPIGNELRFPDEFVRHKVLDLLGDLYLLGLRLKARILALRSGHAANVELVRSLRALHDAEVRERNSKSRMLDIREVMRILPHRYPFLLIDRVIELEGYRRAVGIKNVSINEPYFQGHWPGQPVMPGVLIVEAMAQLSGVLLLRKLEHTGKLAVLLSIDQIKLRRAVVPGDQLRIESVAENVKPRTGRVICRATVDGKLAAQARIKFMLVDAN